MTRDRKELDADWLGVPFRIIDTGGWMPGGSALDVKVSRQVEAAVQAADVVLLVVDTSVGMTDDDEAIADWLRRGRHDVIVVANQGRQRPARGRAVGVPRPRSGRAVPDQRPPRPARR